MQNLLVRILRNEFEKFLRQHGKMWEVHGHSGWDECAQALEMTVDELMGAVESYAPDDHHVYVFSAEMTPLEILDQVTLEELREVDAKALDAYIVRCGTGNDFLYFACDLNEASNGNPFTLAPAACREE